MAGVLLFQTTGGFKSFPWLRTDTTPAYGPPHQRLLCGARALKKPPVMTGNQRRARSWRIRGVRSATWLRKVSRLAVGR